MLLSCVLIRYVNFGVFAKYCMYLAA